MRRWRGPRRRRRGRAGSCASCGRRLDAASRPAPRSLLSFSPTRHSGRTRRPRPSRALVVMSETKQSFLRGLFAGAVHDPLLFPYPPTLDVVDPAEARTVRRLIDELEGMERSGLIDSARFDEEETLPEEVIEAFARIGLLGISIPKEYGGLGLSPAAFARVFATTSAAAPGLGCRAG